MKRFAIALALAALAASPAAAAAPAPAPQPALSAQGVDVREFIQQIARLTDMTFIVDARVKGTVSAPAETPASRDELFDLLVSTLRASGLVATPSVGGAYRISPAPEQVRRTSAHNQFLSDGTLRL